MSEMIERVARVIGCNNPEVCDYDKQDNPETCDLCLDRARAAITAMREPTEAMMSDPSVYGEDDVEAYQAMIDAALSE